MRPSRLPQSEADLAGWKVYADWLLGRGDPLGELLSIELSLPDAPNTLELQRFHHVAKRHCHASKFLEVGWCLGHARTVAVVPEAPGMPMTKRLMPATITAEQLVELGTFLQRPSAQLVETVAVALTPELAPAFLKAMKHAPAGCRVKPLSGDIAPLIGAFPTLDLREYRYPFLHLPAEKGPTLIAGSIPLLRQGRAQLQPGDAALLDVAAQHLDLLSPLPLTTLQKRHGVIAVKAQLNRTVPELHPGPPPLMRYPGGTWKVRVDHEYFATSVDDRPVAVGESAPVVTGSRVLCQGQERVFLEDAALWPDFCP